MAALLGEPGLPQRRVRSSACTRDFDKREDVVHVPPFLCRTLDGEQLARRLLTDDFNFYTVADISEEQKLATPTRRLLRFERSLSIRQQVDLSLIHI